VRAIIDDVVLDVQDLHTIYRLRRRQVRAVDGVHLTVRRGERVGVVGESGSGKSTLAFSILRLLRPPGEIVGGRVVFEGLDLLSLGERQMTEVRGARIGLVYQDPFTYLNPVLTVGNQIMEPFVVHRQMSRQQAREETVRLLDRLELPSPRKVIDAYPHQLSGGQRQRVVIGMAIACRPTLLIADEPTTALDVTVQAQILELLNGLVQEFGMSLLLISHDLSVVSAVCDRVYVMYAGQIVESGPMAALSRSPHHPYTAALLGSSTTVLERKRRFSVIPGVPPDLANPPAGCRFADRCAFRMPVCGRVPPHFPIDDRWSAACWLLDRARSHESA